MRDAHVFLVPLSNSVAGERFNLLQEQHGMHPRITCKDDIGVPGISCPVLGKTIECFKHAYSEGYRWAVHVHQDTIIEDTGSLLMLIQHMKENGIHVAGPSENDGVQRGNFSGHGYIHSSFMVVDLENVGRWWDVDAWIDNGWIVDGKQFRLQGMEFYWKVCWKRQSKLLKLRSEWRVPKLGKSTSIFWGDHLIASHLWYSSADDPGRTHTSEIDGVPKPQLLDYREAWFDEYSRPARQCS